MEVRSQFVRVVLKRSPPFQILQCISHLELLQLIGTGVKARYIASGASHHHSGGSNAQYGVPAQDIHGGMILKTIFVTSFCRFSF